MSFPSSGFDAQTNKNDALEEFGEFLYPKSSVNLKSLVRSFMLASLATLSVSVVLVFFRDKSVLEQIRWGWLGMPLLLFLGFEFGHIFGTLFRSGLAVIVSQSGVRWTNARRYAITWKEVALARVYVNDDGEVVRIQLNLKTGRKVKIDYYERLELMRDVLIQNPEIELCIMKECGVCVVDLGLLFAAVALILLSIIIQVH